MTFTLATYNVLASAYIRPEWYPNTERELLDDSYRRPAVAQYVAALDADIICLQEVERDAFALIEQELVVLGYEGQRVGKGGGRPDGCATFFRSDLFALVDEHRLEFQEHLGDLASGHVAQIIRLEHDDRELTIVNTHLKWDPPGTPIEQQYGYRQVRELLTWKDENSVGVPWIVCGDFNATPRSDVVQLLQRAGFQAGHAGQPKAATCNAHQRAKLIDYVFHGGGLKQEPVALIPAEDTTPLPGPGQPSDHVPVIAEFDFE